MGSFGTDWYFGYQLFRHSELPPNLAVLYFLVGYIVLRVYYHAVAGMNHNAAGLNEVLQRLDLIWSVRSAKVCSEIYPDINECYETLKDLWGKERTDEVLRITINITERNEDEAARLRSQIKDTSLFKDKKVFFIRPKFDTILEDHTLEMIGKYCHLSIRTFFVLLLFMIL